MFRRLLAAAAVLLSFTPSPARGAPMVTRLETIRADAATVVVGTVRSDKGGLSFDVEYALRGRAAKGRMAVRESPDGHVFVELDVKKNRVVGFIDDENRLRWVGRLLAGPSLEKGVILLQGFFDYNAHNVEPGLLTLAQLRSYLSSGTLVQRYRATLAFPDGKGGIRASARSFEVEYDALARNTTVIGLEMACLEDGRMQSPLWGRFSLHFYCRDRSRSLALSGAFTGVDASTGEILTTAVPLHPFLYESEFDRYIGDATATDVQRIIEVSSQGRTWKWRVGGDLVGPGGRAHRANGGSSGSRSVKGQKTSYEIYRFAGKTKLSVTHSGGQAPWMSNDFFMLQLIDGNSYAHCSLAEAGQRSPCRLTQAAPVWKRGPAYKRTRATEAIAIQVAERFVAENGYTDLPPTSHLANLSRESLEPTEVRARLRMRHDTLERAACGVTGSPQTGWYVVFRYQGKPRSPRGRAVEVTPYGRAVRVVHQDFLLKHARALGTHAP